MVEWSLYFGIPTYIHQEHTKTYSPENTSSVSCLLNVRRLLFIENDDECEDGCGHRVKGDEVVDGAEGLAPAPVAEKINQ